MKIRRCLISVSDKTDLESVAETLKEFNIEILSSGGSAKYLQDLGYTITPIEKITKNPEILNGRVKTLSYQVSAGILFDRDNKNHLEEMTKADLLSIDLVICNLYPFEKKMEQTEDLDQLIESIDIGGPTVLRAAAKNYKHTCAVTHIKDYPNLIDQLKNQNGSTTELFRKEMALKIFSHTYHYDRLIAEVFSRENFELRYGENPHQKAIYIPNSSTPNLLAGKQLHGKEFSYNNFLDMENSLNLLSELSVMLPTYKHVTVYKHGAPCGVCSSKNSSLEKTIEKAWNCDPISAFGSIISSNTEIDGLSANFLNSKFIEIVIAPSFTEEAIKILTQKKNIRLYQISPYEKLKKKSIRQLTGLDIIQDTDIHYSKEIISVTKKSFKEDDLGVFGVITCKYLKSNAVNIVSRSDLNFWVSGAGCAQPNRLDSFALAAKKHYDYKNNSELKDKIESSILVSDAFFPFDDIVKLCTEIDIDQVIQPGGSKNDQAVIQTCNDLNIAMKFTGVRHFNH